jgi:thioredoxin reductase (NADPH)
MGQKAKQAEVIVIGGGLAGLSAAVYLGRALRSVMVIDNGKSMARWEPDVQNYLGFPDGIGGPELLDRARTQARSYRAKLVRDHIRWARVRGGRFSLKGEKSFYTCDRLLIATGIFHLPPEIPGLNSCLGHSMFFCKDCDGYRVQGKRIGIYGWTEEAVEYALAMLHYTSCVVVLTNGHKPRWPKRFDRYTKEYKLPVYTGRISDVEHNKRHVKAIHIGRTVRVELDALFTTRGDIYYNRLARGLGARTGTEGEIVVDSKRRTSVPGLYAAGCVTPANCQMIIAAGEGAAAAQAINRDLFEASLKTHSLRRMRKRQIRSRRIMPPVKHNGRPVTGKDPTKIHTARE